MDPRMERLETVIQSIPESNRINDWLRGQKIGRGSTGTVYLAKNTENGQKFVVKSVKTADTQNRIDLWKEKGVLKSCKSPYIVEYLGYGLSKAKRETDQTTYLDVYMEYVEGGSVRDAIQQNAGTLEEPIVAAYTRDVLKGLDYLHNEKDIVHGDVKCANFLVGKQCIKICDFSSCKLMENGDIVIAPRPGEANRRRIHVTGTHGYSAPEVEDAIMQDRKSDIYSLGCSIVEMVTGHAPGQDPIIYSWEDGSQISVDLPPCFSLEGRELVRMCMEHDPEDRPDAHELLTCRWIATAPPFPRAIEPLFQTEPVRSRSGLRLGWGC